MSLLTDGHRLPRGGMERENDEDDFRTDTVIAFVGQEGADAAASSKS